MRGRSASFTGRSLVGSWRVGVFVAHLLCRNDVRVFGYEQSRLVQP